MKKLIFFILLIINFLYAQDIEITANKFESFEKEKYSKFTTNVVVTKSKDKIKADDLYVYFDEKQNPFKYEAKGNVTFTVFTKTTSYNGKCKELVYFPNKKEFNLIGEATIEEANSDKKVFGDKILFNEKSGDIKVLSDDKAPVKFIFKVKE